MHDIVRETLHEIVDPLVYAEAADLIEEHRAAGREIVIVSSSGAEMVEPIGEMLGVDRVVATRMVTEDGRYTGEIDFYAYGENKAAAMRQVAAEGGYDLADCYAYSDSITDLPMLAAVGHPTAVNPDRGLRKAALEHGWPVLQFTRPVSMRARFSVPPAPVVTGAAVGVGRGGRRAGLVRPAPRAAGRAARRGRRAGPALRPAAAPRRLSPHRRRGTPATAAAVVHPADVFTVVLAWLAVLAVCVAAVLFGQTARTAPPAGGAPSPAGRGSACSCRCPARGSPCSAAAGAGPRSPAAWLAAAAVGACGVVVVRRSSGVTACPALTGRVARRGAAQPRSRLSQIARPSRAPCSVARQQCTSQPATPSGSPDA